MIINIFLAITNENRCHRSILKNKEKYNIEIEAENFFNKILRKILKSTLKKIYPFVANFFACFYSKHEKLINALFQYDNILI